MIENCISLLRKKEEKKARDYIFQKYMTDAFKTMIEAFYSAHNGSINIPEYKDYDTIIKEYKEPQKAISEDDIKESIIKKLQKIGNSNGR